MTLKIGCMYESKKPDNPFPVAKLYREKSAVIINNSWDCQKLAASSRFFVLEHDLATRRNKFGHKLQVNLYKLLLGDGTIGWCMLPNVRSWKRVTAVV